MAVGMHIFREGGPCTNFMLLPEGHVRIYKNSDDGRETTLYRVSPGEFRVLSLRSLMCNECFSADAVADTGPGRYRYWFGRLRACDGCVARFMQLLAESTYAASG